MSKRKGYVVRAVAAAAVLALGTALWLSLSSTEEKPPAQDCLQRMEEAIHQAETEGFIEAQDGTTTIGSGKIQLVYSSESGQFALLYDGEERLSSNPGEAQLAQVSSTGEQEKLSSLAYLQYVNGRQERLTMTTRKDGIREGICRVLTKGSILRVYYVLGEKEEEAFVPQVLRAKVFEEQILPGADSTGARRLKKYFQKYSVNDVMTAAEKKELLAKYPGLEREDLYLFSGATDRLAQELAQLIAAAGYTREDYAADLAIIGTQQQEQTDKDVFLLPLEFRLENEEFTASVLSDQIAVSNPDCTLETIWLLPGFGWSVSQEGFLLLPDGGGTYISLADVAAQGRSFSKEIYGPDGAVAGFETLPAGLPASLPSYICRAGDFGYTAAIVSGAASATLEAAVQGGAQPVTRAGFSFTYKPHIQVETGKTDQMAFVNVFSQKPVTDSFTVCYALAFEEAALTEEGLLARNRDMLTRYGILPETSVTHPNSETLFVDFTCLIRDEKHNGRTVVLSTFEEIEEVVKRLHEEGVRESVITLKGITDQGTATGMGNPFAPSSKLGGKQGLQKLYQTVKEKGYTLYLSYDMAQIYRDSWGDGFSPTADAAKGLEQLVLRRAEFDPMTLSPVRDAAHRLRYLLHPALYPERMQQVLKYFGSVRDSADGVSLADSGLLYADYNKEKEVLRTDAQRFIQEACTSLADSTSLLLESPNSYLWGRADLIADLPVYSTGLMVETYAYPYLPILLNGRMSYAAESVTLAADPAMQILDTVLAGASLKVSWITRPDSVLMETSYADSLASVSVENSFEEMLEEYKKYNQSTDILKGQELTGLRILGDQAFAALYSGGGALVVNKGSDSIQAGGITIDPHTYAAVKEGLA